MDRDPAPGAAERKKASIEEALGKLTGDTKAKREGHEQGAETRVPSTAANAEGEPQNVTRK